MVKISFDDKTIDFTFDSDQKASSLLKGKELKKGVSNYLDYLSEDDASVVYKNVKQDVDLAYQVRENYLKEDIIINKPTSDASFTFKFKANGLSLIHKNNSLCFSDKKTGETLFQTGPLCMEDSNGKYSNKVDMQVKQVGNEYYVTIIPDAYFLADIDTLYPVIVDPTIYFVYGSSTTYDSFVGSLEPDRNFNSGTNMPYLRTGKDTAYGIRRTYLKFALPAISGSPVFSYIKLSLTSRGASYPTIKAYRSMNNWSSDTLKWNNKPSYDLNYVSNTAYGVDDTYYRMDVNEIVKRWYNGTYYNWGFVIRDEYESNTSLLATWKSSDNSAVLARPRLQIITAISPDAMMVGANYTGSEEGKIDFSWYANNATGYLIDTYACSALTSSNATTVRNSLATKAVVAIFGHGGPGSQHVYDSNNNITTLAGNNVSGVASLEYGYGSGTATMDGVRLILFFGCRTALTHSALGNLLDRSAQYGADCAVGFTNNIHDGILSGKKWNPVFWLDVENGSTVSEALQHAAETVALWNFGDYLGFDSYTCEGASYFPGDVCIDPARYGD